MTISVLETVLALALQPEGALHGNYMARNLFDLPYHDIFCNFG